MGAIKDRVTGLFSQPSEEDVVRQNLQEIRQLIDEFPAYNVATAESMGWERFIANEPLYIQGDSMLASMIAHGGVEVLNGLDRDLTGLAGAIIRYHFTDEELIEMGKDGR